LRGKEDTMGSISGKLRAAPTRRLALTPQLRRALDLLRMDAADLAQVLEDEAAANPWLVLSWPLAQTGPLPETEARGPGLHAHVLLWIDRQFPPGDDRRLALALAEVLEPTGWLGEMPEQIAARTGQPLGRLRDVLARLQRIEPAGLFARDLAECLRLQAQAAGVLDAAMQAVLARLDLLARGGVAAVAQAAHVPVAELAAAVARLRGFDPKPGLAFEPAPAQVSRRHVPDLVARRNEGGGWQAELHPAALPQLAVRPDAGPGNAAARDAAALIALVVRRNRTLLTLADAVLAVQGPSLDLGAPALRPLTPRRQP
jgi:RNA polymerase sigma-54 factor